MNRISAVLAAGLFHLPGLILMASIDGSWGIVALGVLAVGTALGTTTFKRSRPLTTMFEGPIPVAPILVFHLDRTPPQEAPELHEEYTAGVR